MPKKPGPYIILFSLLITLNLFLLSKSSIGSVFNLPFLSIAQISALLGTILFSYSFILSSRVRALEDLFGGLDKVYRWHHDVGVWSFSFLAIHFLSLIINSLILQFSLWSAITSDGTGAYFAGIVGFFIMAGIIFTIIFSKIRYEHFVNVQKFFAIPLALGIFHVLFISSDVSRSPLLGIFILAHMFLAVMYYSYRGFFYKTFAPHKEYSVSIAEQKGADITEIILKPKTDRISFVPGQFGYFGFKSTGVSRELHPFSFASAEQDEHIRLAIKNVGDFTAQLKLLHEGDNVTVYGPYGRFAERISEYNAEIVLVGAGIGITPILSIAHSLSSGSFKGRQTATLFYCTRNLAEAVFHAELNSLGEISDAFKYVLHLSKDRGYLNADTIRKTVGKLDNKLFLICGPITMMRSLAADLHKQGVPKENIVFEEFKYA